MAAVHAGLQSADKWTDPAADKLMLARVQNDHGELCAVPNLETVSLAIAHFKKNRETDGWRGLKRVCFGATLLDRDGWCILSDDTLRTLLFDIIASHSEMRRRLRCFQFLLSSYWNFSLSSARNQAKEGWLLLRAWLHREIHPLANELPRKPAWFMTLVEHDNLLQNNPCDRYSQKLLSGAGEEFQAVVVKLAIPSDSWIFEEAMLAPIRVGCRCSDNNFIMQLPDLLALAMGRANTKPPTKLLQIRCIALLLTRYSALPDTPENPALRDAALSVIGNPWLHKPSWDANVVDEHGKPDNLAREMILSWLKRRLIKDFFELLSEDQTGDSRRLDYWLRFEPAVNDMWFALGNNTRERSGENFEDFKRRAKGRLLLLEETTSDNNAFIMRIGQYLAVEFGVKGHACFLFQWDRLPAKIANALAAGKENTSMNLWTLKSAFTADKRLIHRDNLSKKVLWEHKFDQEICPLINHWPKDPQKVVATASVRRGSQAFFASEPQQENSTRYAPQGKQMPKAIPEEIKRLVSEWGLRMSDNRAMGGAIWIHADDTFSIVRTTLRNGGFRYKPGKGWWKE
ncbi:MAG: hypothetical protein HQM06_16465 [Magnetococcales bacterium]|nr:hypothetical protein [Magnetococcales bacterium]